MIRRKATGDTVFASVIEPHGAYSSVSELSENSDSSIAQLKVVFDDANYTAVSIIDKKGQVSLFILANIQSSDAKQHQLKIDGKSFEWTGHYYFKDDS